MGRPRGRWPALLCCTGHCSRGHLCQPTDRCGGGCGAFCPNAKARPAVPLPVGPPSAPRLHRSGTPSTGRCLSGRPTQLALDADPLAEGSTASEPQAVWHHCARPQTEAATTLPLWDVPTHLCTQLTWLLAGKPFWILDNCQSVLSLQAAGSREPCSPLHQGSPHWLSRCK